MYKVLIVFLFGIIITACKKTVAENPEKLHNCYLNTVVSSGLDDTYFYDENNNLIEHILRDIYYTSVQYKYNSNQQVNQRIRLFSDNGYVIDSTEYIYDNNTLIKTINKRFSGFMSDPIEHIYTTGEIFEYKLNGDNILSTIFLNNQVQSYRERFYENDKLKIYKKYNKDHVEIENTEFEYDTINNVIEVLKNGQQYKKIWYDNKNCPVKNINLFNSQNIRISFASSMFFSFFSETGFLESDHNPIKIETQDNIVNYTYDYNEFGYPTTRSSDQLSDPISIGFSYDCIKAETD